MVASCRHSMAFHPFAWPTHKVSIQDPRAVFSYGGGMCPEQHWGRLADGRTFYFRFRGGGAELRVGPWWTPDEKLPMSNPLFDWELFNQSLKGEAEYALPYIFFAGPIGAVNVCYEDDPYRGWFKNDEERQRTFTRCLDDVERQDVQAKEMGIDPYCDEVCICS